MCDKPKFVQFTTMNDTTGGLNKTIVIALDRINAITHIEQFKLNNDREGVGFYVEYIGDGVGADIRAPIEYSQWLHEQYAWLLDQLEIVHAPEVYKNKKEKVKEVGEVVPKRGFTAHIDYTTSASLVIPPNVVAFSCFCIPDKKVIISGFDDYPLEIISQSWPIRVSPGQEFTFESNEENFIDVQFYYKEKEDL